VRRAALGVALVVATAAAPACSGYEPRPLDATAALAELRRQPAPAPASGLRPEEAAALALALSPRLRAVRVQRDVAETAVVSAAAWDNPEIRMSLDKLFSGGPLSFGVGVRFFPPPPGERDARAERARAEARLVLAEIEEQEAEVAAEAFGLHARVLCAERKLAEARRAAERGDRLVALARERADAGAATGLEVLRARLERAERASDEERLAAEREELLAELGGLLGASSFSATLVPGAPWPPLEAAGQAELEQLALARRASLRGLRAAYDASERDLELAHLARLPWPRFLQAGVGDLGDRPGLDVSAGVELPIADTGEGAIAAAEARREAARAAFVAGVAATQGEVRVALVRVREEERRRRAYAERVAPVIADAERIAEEHLRSGAADALAIEQFADRMHDARAEEAEIALALEEARIQLAVATGTVLARGAPRAPQGTRQTNP
jgi:cobalt-zinc-cadmium efflux system outer membrane protein